MFRYTTRITLRDADAAGVLFFARYFSLAHDAYEAFLEAQGFGVGRILNEESYIIPIVRAEAEYKAPLRVGQTAIVRLHVAELRRRTFSIVCELLTPENKVACLVRTVHVVVDKATGRSVPLPRPLVAALEKGMIAKDPCETAD